MAPSLCPKPVIYTSQYGFWPQCEISHYLKDNDQLHVSVQRQYNPCLEWITGFRAVVIVVIVIISEKTADICMIHD